MTPLTEGYYVFQCSDVAECELKSSSDITALTGNLNLLVYQYVSSKFKQIKNNQLISISGKLISCPKGVISTFATNGECVLAEDGIYMNPKTDTITQPLIKADDTIKKGDATGVTPTAGSFFIDQSSKDSSDPTKFHKLIKCTSTTECISDKPVTGIYLDEATKYASNPPEYTNLITCNEEKCSTSVDTSTATSIYYLNLAVTDKLQDAIIQCTSAKCKKINGVSGGYYLNNGSDKTAKPLIKCDSSKCFSTDDFKVGVAYLDGGSYASSKFANIIKCTSSTSCGNPSPAFTADNEIFYHFINGVGSSINDAIITCTGATIECKAEKGNVGYYVDAFDDKHIITCTSSTCSSGPGSTVQGHAYIGASTAAKKSLIISFSDGKFVSEDIANSINANDSNVYYIDATNPKNLISCIGATSGGGTCTSSAHTLSSGDKLAFYTDGTESAHTIVCSSSGCISSQGN